MPCDPDPNGYCIVLADDLAAPPLPLVPQVPLTGIGFVGTADGFTMNWDVDAEDHTVYVQMREEGGGLWTDWPRKQAPRSAGTLTVTGLDPDKVYQVAIRLFTAYEMDPEGVITQILTDDSWTSESEIVYHRSSLVEHGADVILVG